MSELLCFRKYLKTRRMPCTNALACSKLEFLLKQIFSVTVSSKTRLNSRIMCRDFADLVKGEIQLVSWQARGDEWNLWILYSCFDFKAFGREIALTFGIFFLRKNLYPVFFRVPVPRVHLKRQDDQGWCRRTKTFIHQGNKIFPYKKSVLTRYGNLMRFQNER